MSDKLLTIAMTPKPEFEYDPIPLILSGEKVHTLRKRGRCGPDFEVTVKKKRTGIVLWFCRSKYMVQSEFLNDEFAYADGFRGTSPAKNLQAFLEHFYGKVPATMWCSHFEVIQRPEEDTT